MAPLNAILAFAAALVVPAQGSAFLGAQPGHRLAEELVKQALSSEFALLSSERTRSLEVELRPLFESLPKNEAGKLEAAAVRYALHRFWTKKHGWSVKGLSHEGQSWNASSPTAGVMKAQVPDYLHKLMADRVHGDGLDLGDLAVFAATLDDLILGEIRSGIVHIYENLNLSMSGYQASATEGAAVLGRFLVAYISGYHEEDGNYESMRQELEDSFLSWPNVQMFAEDQQRAFETQRQRRRPFSSGVSFEDHVEIAQDFTKNLMTWQHTECNAWKNRLVEMENQGSGRVRLGDFYSGKDRDDWHFLESPDYLRAVGALDESISGKPSVIIPNYLIGMSNCLDPSEYFSVCCQDECEDLMAEIEGKIGHPSALPGDIVEIVSAMASDTVDAPRNLSSPQLTRLQEIAEHHSGRVPLHGRLFAQWMHHAYPRECPFPHVAGTTKPVSQDEWELLGLEAEATDEEMAWHSAQSFWSETETIHDLPWHGQEDLVSVHKHVAQRMQSGGWGSLRMLGFLAFGISALVPFVRGAKDLKSAFLSADSVDKKLERHLV